MTKPERLLHVFSTFDYGGAEARTLQLMRHFGDQADHVVLIGERSEMGAVAQIDPAVCVTIPLIDTPSVLGRPSLRRYWQLAKYMRDFDLILTYSWGAMDAVMAHRLFGRILGLAPLIHHEDGHESADKQWSRVQFRRVAMQTCQAVIVPSSVLEQVAKAEWKIQPARLHRITNGIELARYRQLPVPGSFPELVKRHGEITVGTVAGLRPVKNLPRLVRAVAAAGPDIRLAIAGEGPERASIVAEARRLNIADRLLLPGFLPDPASYLGHFDVFALSSDSEQYPIALAEAMAAGLPVVATDVGDIRAMVAPSNLPFIVPVHDEAAFANAIARLAVDQELRSQIGRDNAAQAAAEFPQERMFSYYRSVYAAATTALTSSGSGRG